MPPSPCRTATKLALRCDLVERLHKEKERQAEQFYAEVMQPHVQAAVKSYLDSLKKK